MIKKLFVILPGSFNSLFPPVLLSANCSTLNEWNEKAKGDGVVSVYSRNLNQVLFINNSCRINKRIVNGFCAALAHLVEQLICNHQVVSSIPTRGTIY